MVPMSDMIPSRREASRSRSSGSGYLVDAGAAVMVGVLAEEGPVKRVVMLAGKLLGIPHVICQPAEEGQRIAEKKTSGDREIDLQRIGKLPAQGVDRHAGQAERHALPEQALSFPLVTEHRLFPFGGAPGFGRDAAGIEIEQRRLGHQRSATTRATAPPASSAGSSRRITRRGDTPTRPEP